MSLEWHPPLEASCRSPNESAYYYKLTAPNLFTFTETVQSIPRRPLLGMDADTLDVQLFDGHIEAWRLVVATLLCWVITSLSVSAGGVTLPTSRHPSAPTELRASSSYLPLTKGVP